MAELLQPLNIAFMHPDLGIGGAERLVVDCALGLKSQGHSVTIYTSHCDMDHCFEEIKSGEIPVEVIGDSLPTNVAGKFSIACATLRQLWLTISLMRSKEIKKYDLVFVDQLSTSLTLLQSCKPKVLFYCHFPDQLLAQEGGLMKKIYRYPFNWIEQYTTGLADGLFVNSNFTKSVFHKTYRNLGDKIAEVEVLYPCVETGVNVNKSITSLDKKFFDGYLKNKENDIEYLLSVNRFERKKDIELAIESFKNAKECLGESRKNKTKLIVAGGYDNRVLENVEYLIELETLCKKLHLNFETMHYNSFSKSRPPKLNHGIEDLDVVFLTSISTSLKNLLITKSKCLLYTPSFEHFGIVPIESMNLGTPVLACNNGGPRETVEHDETGWLAEPTVDDWTKYLLVCLLSADTAKMKQKCEKQVLNKFSRAAMTDALQEKISKMMKVKKRPDEKLLTAVLATVNFALFYALDYLFDIKHVYYVYGIMVFFNSFVMKNRLWAFYWTLFAAIVYFRTQL